METDFAFESGTVVDHLIIFAEPIGIDGAGGILARAGFCATIDDLAAIGGMQFDNADLDNLEGQGTLEDVILHEMGHVRYQS